MDEKIACEYCSGDGDSVWLTHDDRAGTRRIRTESGHTKTLGKFECPECGGTIEVCPVCMGEMSFYGESSGKTIICHNCMPEEAARQDSSPW